MSVEVLYKYIDIQIHFDNHNMNTIINKYLLAAQYNEEQCQWISQIQIDNHNMNTMINIYDKVSYELKKRVPPAKKLITRSIMPKTPPKITTRYLVPSQIQV